MKKYIKFFDEDKKRMRRVPVLTCLSVDVKFHKDVCIVRLYDKPTNLCPFSVVLDVEDETLQKFCNDLIDCHVATSVEEYMRNSIERDYRRFLEGEQKSWPLNKLAMKWVTELKFVLGICYLRMGKDIAELAPTARKIFEE